MFVDSQPNKPEKPENHSYMGRSFDSICKDGKVPCENYLPKFVMVALKKLLASPLPHETFAQYLAKNDVADTLIKSVELGGVLNTPDSYKPVELLGLLVHIVEKYPGTILTDNDGNMQNIGKFYLNSMYSAEPGTDKTWLSITVCVRS